MIKKNIYIYAKNVQHMFGKHLFKYLRTTAVGSINTGSTEQFFCGDLSLIQERQLSATDEKMTPEYSLYDKKA